MCSKEAGVQNDRWGYGCSVADYDNDGWPDLYVGNYGKNRLYHNNHDGTFTDEAEKAGVGSGNWSPGSTWGDYDGDGRLDLYVTGYVHFDRNNLPITGTKAVNYASCLYRGVSVNCGPRGLPGEPDHLFHNNGNGKFTDVTVKAGVEDKDKYYGFSTIFVDINNDGKPDLVVGNDSEPNFLYINKGDGTFDDESYVSGFALNKDGREIASMGIAAGDYENNGLIDFFVTDFGDDYKVLYHNDGDASFTDVSYKAGVAQTTIPFVGWGDGFLDYDNDGWLDLFEMNGHVYPEVDQHDWGTTLAERPLLFHNVPDGGQGTEIRVRSAGKRIRAGGGGSGARRRVWRSVQRRQNRCGHQSDRRATGAAEECESGSSSLGGDGAGGRNKSGNRQDKPARCNLCDCLPEGERHAAATGCAFERKLYFVRMIDDCTLVWAMRRMRERRRSIGRRARRRRSRCRRSTASTPSPRARGSRARCAAGKPCADPKACRRMPSPFESTA